MKENNGITLTCNNDKCRNKYLFQRTEEGKLPYNFPFCSTRCKDADLYLWLMGGISIREPLSNAQQQALGIAQQKEQESETT